jgi:iron(III) transport system substrate-binding protein
MLATMIATQGEAAAEAWARGLKANLAQKPAGGDREQVRDVFSGKCDVALGNTYYMALMMTNAKNPEQQAWAKSVKLLFPNANDRGSHVNISGVALTKSAPNKVHAIQLIEFLASTEAQAIYADVNNEYPVSPSVQASDLVKGFGTLKPDSVPLDAIAKYRAKASEIMDRVRFDDGP